MVACGVDRRRLARVAVVGTSGAGKTTLARRLAAALDAPHTELDALYWGPAWTPVPSEIFRRRVREAVAAPRWVIDGNYGTVRELVWGRATTLVWLDLGFARTFSRAVWRTARRIVTREELFGGNRESLRNALDPEWIPWWVLRTWRRRRREVPRRLGEPAFAHLQVVRLRRPREVRRLVEALADPDGGDATS